MWLARKALYDLPYEVSKYQAMQFPIERKHRHDQRRQRLGPLGQGHRLTHSKWNSIAADGGLTGYRTGTFADDLTASLSHPEAGALLTPLVVVMSLGIDSSLSGRTLSLE